MKKRGIVAVVVLLLIGLDQLVKSYIVQQIPLGEVRSWIPNFVKIGRASCRERVLRLV